MGKSSIMSWEDYKHLSLLDVQNYYISNGYVIVERGLVSKEVHSLPIYMIISVELHRSMIQRISGFVRLFFTSGMSAKIVSCWRIFATTVKSCIWICFMQLTSHTVELGLIIIFGISKLARLILLSNVHIGVYFIIPQQTAFLGESRDLASLLIVKTGGLIFNC